MFSNRAESKKVKEIKDLTDLHKSIKTKLKKASIRIDVNKKNRCCCTSCNDTEVIYKPGSISRYYNGDIKKMRELLQKISYCISELKKSLSRREQYNQYPILMMLGDICSLGSVALYPWMEYQNVTRHDLNNPHEIVGASFISAILAIFWVIQFMAGYVIASELAGEQIFKISNCPLGEVLGDLREIYNKAMIKDRLTRKDLLRLLEFTKTYILKELAFYPQERRLAFLSASHPRLGKKSALNQNFFNNEISANKNLNNLIFSFLEGDLEKGSAERKSDGYEATPHASTYLTHAKRDSVQAHAIDMPNTGPVIDLDISGNEETNVVTFHF